MRSFNDTRRPKRRLFQSSNPMLSEAVLEKKRAAAAAWEGKAMTVRGTIDKTFFLFAILMMSTAVSYTVANPLFTWGGAIAGLIAVVVASFRPKTSPYAAPIYAFFEGLFVGGISAMYAAMYDGIIFKAVTLTFALLFVMLFIYRSGLIKVTGKFRMGVMMATGAVFVFYMMSWILSLFGIRMPLLHEGGIMGIGISLVIIGIASMNLLLDFDNFEKGEQAEMPSYFEWFFGMGLIVTLVWLYIEILRLLSMLNRD